MLKVWTTDFEINDVISFLQFCFNRQTKRDILFMTSLPVSGTLSRLLSHIVDRNKQVNYAGDGAGDAALQAIANGYVRLYPQEEDDFQFNKVTHSLVLYCIS